jgi:hypothetical protein
MMEVETNPHVQAQEHSHCVQVNIHQHGFNSGKEC